MIVTAGEVEVAIRTFKLLKRLRRITAWWRHFLLRTSSVGPIANASLAFDGVIFF